jgi:hypothetical protein
MLENILVYVALGTSVLNLILCLSILPLIKRLRDEEL